MLSCTARRGADQHLRSTSVPWATKPLFVSRRTRAILVPSPIAGSASVKAPATSTRESLLVHRLGDGDPDGGVGREFGSADPYVVGDALALSGTRSAGSSKATSAIALDPGADQEASDGPFHLRLSGAASEKCCAGAASPPAARPPGALVDSRRRHPDLVGRAQLGEPCPPISVWEKARAVRARRRPPARARRWLRRSASKTLVLVAGDRARSTTRRISVERSLLPTRGHEVGLPRKGSTASVVRLLRLPRRGSTSPRRWRRQRQAGAVVERGPPASARCRSKSAMKKGLPSSWAWTGAAEPWCAAVKKLGLLVHLSSGPPPLGGRDC